MLKHPRGKAFVPCNEAAHKLPVLIFILAYWKKTSLRLNHIWMGALPAVKINGNEWGPHYHLYMISINQSRSQVSCSSDESLSSKGKPPRCPCSNRFTVLWLTAAVHLVNHCHQRAHHHIVCRAINLQFCDWLLLYIWWITAIKGHIITLSAER